MDAVPSLTELFPTPQSTTRGTNSPDELGQDDFMTLMVAQLENQDPTKPMDNFEFLSQIAQFGTVNGIQDLQSGLSDLSGALLSNQALQAADLVGREVVTGSNIGALGKEGELNAEIDLPQTAAGVTLYIQDAGGRLVGTQALGPASGTLNVQWDGNDGNGDRMPPGVYRLSAEAEIAGQNQAVSVYAHQRVESVTVDPSGFGTKINLAGGNQVSMAEINRIF